MLFQKSQAPVVITDEDWQHVQLHLSLAVFTPSNLVSSLQSLLPCPPTLYRVPGVAVPVATADYNDAKFREAFALPSSFNLVPFRYGNEG